MKITSPGAQHQEIRLFLLLQPGGSALPAGQQETTDFSAVKTESRGLSPVVFDALMLTPIVIFWMF
ncbi:hypothetical protein [Propionivibrio sp.]|uniref:hypothetical protein n=1 Tax=Propionivibrio sp. TaxID=2212460 RepID=UPI003BF28111